MKPLLRVQMDLFASPTRPPEQLRAPEGDSIVAGTVDGSGDKSGRRSGKRRRTGVRQ
jgi:hypothetical protein